MATPPPCLPIWSCSCKCGLKLALVLLCLLSLSFLPSNTSASSSVQVKELHNKNNPMTVMSSKMVLGSRPPRCINRCMNCMPCMAVLVIPPRRRPNSSSIGHRREDDVNVKTPRDDEGYYLLSWKCRCKNKLFQP